MEAIKILKVEYDALKVKNDALEREKNALKVENDVLKVEKDALEAENVSLKTECNSLRGKLEAQDSIGFEVEYLDETSPTEIRSSKTSKRTTRLGDIMICSRCGYSSSNVSNFNAHIKQHCPGLSFDKKKPKDHQCFICGIYFDSRGLSMHLSRFKNTEIIAKSTTSHKDYTSQQHIDLHAELAKKIKQRRENGIEYDPETWHL